MDITAVFILLTMAGLLWNIVIAIAIHNRLQDSRLLVNMATMRYAPWTRLSEYKQLTEAETGKTGSLYYHYIISILFTGVSGVILVFLFLTG